MTSYVLTPNSSAVQVNLYEYRISSCGKLSATFSPLQRRKNNNKDVKLERCVETTWRTVLPPLASHLFQTSHRMHSVVCYSKTRTKAVSEAGPCVIRWASAATHNGVRCITMSQRMRLKRCIFFFNGFHSVQEAFSRVHYKTRIQANLLVA